MSLKNHIFVKESFDITGRGVGVIPFESLPFGLFRKRYRVLLELPNGKCIESIASVESLLISVSKKEEYFTFILKSFKASQIPKNTKISIIEEL